MIKSSHFRIILAIIPLKHYIGLLEGLLKPGVLVERNKDGVERVTNGSYAFIKVSLPVHWFSLSLLRKKVLLNVHRKSRISNLPWRRIIFVPEVTV